MPVWVITNGMGNVLKVCKSGDKAFMFAIAKIYNYENVSNVQKMEAIRRLSKRYEKDCADYYVELGDHVICIEQCEMEEE